MEQSSSSLPMPEAMEVLSAAPLSIPSHPEDEPASSVPSHTEDEPASSAHSSEPGTSESAAASEVGDAPEAGDASEIGDAPEMGDTSEMETTTELSATTELGAAPEPDSASDTTTDISMVSSEDAPSSSTASSSSSSSSSHSPHSKIDHLGMVHIPKNQPFTSQKGGQRNSTLNLIREVLDRVSGGQEAAVLSAYLDSRAGTPVKKALSPMMSTSPKMTSVLKAIRLQHAKAEPRDKAQWLSLVSCFTMKELEEMGFNVSSRTVATARRHANNVGAGEPVAKPKQPPSKAPLSQATRDTLRDFLYRDDISQAAPNRVVRKGEEVTPVRYVNCCFSCAYSKYMEAHPEAPISESSFRKYTPKEIKRNLKKSELCQPGHRGGHHLPHDPEHDLHSNMRLEHDHLGHAGQLVDLAAHIVG